jgi:hypothetical protein
MGKTILRPRHGVQRTGGQSKVFRGGNVVLLDKLNKNAIVEEDDNKKTFKVETAGGSIQKKIVLKSNVVGGLRNLAPKNGETNQRATLNDGSALVRPGFSGSGGGTIALEKIKTPISLTKKKKNQRDNIRLSL